MIDKNRNPIHISTDRFRKLVHDIHDIDCNQNYDKTLPYSFHLKAVEAQYDKFKHLLPSSDKFTYHSDLDSIRAACILHDSIEDARMTWNDVYEFCLKYTDNPTLADLTADTIYNLTDEKGKGRKERKNDKYYRELKNNKYAVYIKLADIAANTLYSKLTNSKKYKMYKTEFKMFKAKTFKVEYTEFFDYVESL